MASRDPRQDRYDRNPPEVWVVFAIIVTFIIIAAVFAVPELLK